MQQCVPKATAVRMIMSHMPPDCLTMVTNHVSHFGWNACVFSDDSLGNKRLYPGHVYRHERPDGIMYRQ